jgi:hypothetical protein
MTPFDSVERRQLEARSKSGARWFFVIAAFSLITSIISLTGSSLVFLISLGITQIVDAMARGAATKAGGAAVAVALVFDLIAAGISRSSATSRRSVTRGRSSSAWCSMRSTRCCFCSC